MAFNPVGQQYHPSNDNGTAKPFEVEGVPKTGTIIPTLLRLAMRRLPGFGFGAPHGGHSPSVVKNAVTIGSHGSTK